MTVSSNLKWSSVAHVLYFSRCTKSGGVVIQPGTFCISYSSPEHRGRVPAVQQLLLCSWCCRGTGQPQSQAPRTQQLHPASLAGAARAHSTCGAAATWTQPRALTPKDSWRQELCGAGLEEQWATVKTAQVNKTELFWHLPQLGISVPWRCC